MERQQQRQPQAAVLQVQLPRRRRPPHHPHRPLQPLRPPQRQRQPERHLVRLERRRPRPGRRYRRARQARHRSEPVTCSSATLTNTWGTLTYNSGNGSNVLTFKGTIGANVSGALNITGWSGTISDLAGNPIGATDLAQKNLATLDTSHTYAIAYDLAGGTLPSGRSNPYTYIYEDQRILLANPLRPGYVFAGWTGTGISGLTNAVNIYRSHGDRAYVANWTPITYSVHFDAGAADATGSMPDQSLTYDAPQALSSNAFTRAGYAFAGWRGVDGAIHPDRATVLNLTNAQDAVVCHLS